MTPEMLSGSYSLEFYYHARGDHIGVLNVFARQIDSAYNELLWYHSAKFNQTINSWTKVAVNVNQDANFKVSVRSRSKLWTLLQRAMIRALRHQQASADGEVLVFYLASSLQDYLAFELSFPITTFIVH